MFSVRCALNYHTNVHFGTIQTHVSEDEDDLGYDLDQYLHVFWCARCHRVTAQVTTCSRHDWKLGTYEGWSRQATPQELKSYITGLTLEERQRLERLALDHIEAS
jgi:hypothetical protein